MTAVLAAVIMSALAAGPGIRLLAQPDEPPAAEELTEPEEQQAAEEELAEPEEQPAAEPQPDQEKEVPAAVTEAAEPEEQPAAAEEPAEPEEEPAAAEELAEPEIPPAAEEAPAVSRPGGQTGGAGGPLVALIDTGVTGNANVVEAVSVIGESPADDNGHGTRMAELIAAENPSVRILSIKALRPDGTADAAALAAAVRYAVDAGADIINISAVGSGKTGRDQLASLAAEANEKGIRIVAAAGNSGTDAKDFIPAGLDGVITVGAADSSGHRLPESNYGECVDWYVAAPSTSEAAARYSGMLSRGAGSADYINVFPGERQNDDPPAPEETAGPAADVHLLFFEHGGDILDLVWHYEAYIPTRIKDGWIEVPLPAPQDTRRIRKTEAFINYMMTGGAEINITPEIVTDPGRNIVKVPARYAGERFSVRLYLPDDTAAYFLMKEDAGIQGLPADLSAAMDSTFYYTYGYMDRMIAEVSLVRLAVQRPGAMNWQKTSWSTDNIRVGDEFTVTAGKSAFSQMTYWQENILDAFGLPRTSYGPMMAFLNHFETVVDSSGNRMPIFENIGGRAEGTLRGYPAGNGPMETWSLSDGWLAGTCANDEQGSGTMRFNGAKIKVIRKDDDGTIHCMFLTDSVLGQDNFGVFALTPETGSLTLKKTSAQTEITDNNSCYSREGAIYDVFRDAECTDTAGVLRTIADGSTNTLTGLSAGTYYVRERNVYGRAACTGYRCDPEYYPDAKAVTVKAGETTVIRSSEEPLLSLPLEIIKLGKNADPDQYPPAGAEFTIRYYAGYYTREELEGREPDRTWVIAAAREEKDGAVVFRAELSAKYLVSGDDLYCSMDGQEGIPLGTILIEETKAPEGYQLEGVVFRAGDSGTGQTADGDSGSSQAANGDSGSSQEAGSIWYDRITLNEKGNRAAPVAGTVLTAEDVLIRRDIDFTKEDSTGEKLAGVPFVLTNTGTGESHVLYTDKNGYASTASSQAKHSRNTNRNTERKGSAANGIWFGSDTPDDAEGALPCGRYTLREIRCEANRGRELIDEIRFTVTERSKSCIRLGLMRRHMSRMILWKSLAV